jgi:hypothetical protein
LIVVELADKVQEMIMRLWSKKRLIGESLEGKILPVVLHQLKATPSYFVASKGRPAKVNSEILQCLLDTSNIMKINWALNVLIVTKRSK